MFHAMFCILLSRIYHKYGAVLMLEEVLSFHLKWLASQEMVQVTILL